MDEVEIKNVGGLRGVASEATLRLLVDKISPGASTNPAATRLQNLHNQSIRNAGNEATTFGGKIKYVGKSLFDLGKEIAVTNKRLSDFTNYNNLVGRSLTSVIMYAEGLVDTFRDLSSVGASFNNNIFDMTRSSADAAMNLDDFVSMVKSNSQELAKFGGTTTRGAKFIGEFGRDLRLGIGNQFLEMGMTIDQINEGLIGYMSLETMRGQRNLRNDAQTQASASNYIMQLDRLAKLTGKQREALMESQMALQTDGQIRNQLARVEQSRGKAAAEELRAIYTLQSESLPAFHSSLMDLSDGVAQTDLAKALQSAVPGITDFARRVASGEMSMDEYNDTMKNSIGPAIQQFAGTVDDATLQVYREKGGIYGAFAQIIDSGYQFSNIMNINSKEAAAEQKRRAKVTATLGKFEQGLIAFQKFLYNTFVDSPFAAALGQAGDDLFKTFSDGTSGAMGTLRSSIQSTMEYLFGKNGFFTKGLEWIVKFVKSDEFQGVLTAVVDKIKAAFDWIGTFVSDAANFGLWESIEKNIIDPITGSNFVQKMLSGFSLLFETVATAFQNFFDGTTGKAMIDSMLLMWDKLLLWAMKGINDTWFGGALISQADIASKEHDIFKREIGKGPFEGNEKQQVQSQLNFLSTEQANDWVGRSLNNERYKERERQINELTEALAENSFAKGTGAFQDFGSGTPAMLHNVEAVVPRDTPAGDLLNEFYKMQKSSKTSEIPSNTDQKEYDAYRAQVEELQKALAENSFAKGTGAFQDFGSGTPAMLHNVEAVVPRNTPAGDLLNAFYEMQQTNQPSKTPSNFNQPGVLDKLNELNTNIMKLINVMQDGVTAQQKTVKNIRSLGTDMYRGAV